MVEDATGSDGETLWNKRVLGERLSAYATASEDVTANGHGVESEEREKRKCAIVKELHGLGEDGIGYVMDNIVTLSGAFGEPSRDLAHGHLARLVEGLAGINPQSPHAAPVPTLHATRVTSILTSFLMKHLQSPGALGHIWNPHRDFRSALRYCLPGSCPECPASHLELRTDPDIPPNSQLTLHNPYPLPRGLCEEWISLNAFAARLFSDGLSSYLNVFIRTVADLLAVEMMDMEMDDDWKLATVFYPDIPRLVKLQVVHSWLQHAGQPLFRKMNKGITGSWKVWGFDIPTWNKLRSTVEEMATEDVMGLGDMWGFGRMEKPEVRDMAAEVAKLMAEVESSVEREPERRRHVEKTSGNEPRNEERPSKEIFRVVENTHGAGLCIEKISHIPVVPLGEKKLSYTTKITDEEVDSCSSGFEDEGYGEDGSTDGGSTKGEALVAECG
ncbi:hypothetical protein MKZ38_003958 [Zalerion maritima]|uniref:Uncharacterized protein n=1 Tax=Zalerion maritima TaxID=339359 RepID=A0AAD5RM92_9PEZI|nr:hypothetical protein MKZ38_003958 [Zalerion maritima]